MIKIIIPILGAIWRAWLGGSFNSISRIWKILTLWIMLIVMYYSKYYNLDFLKTWQFYSVAIIYMRYWNHSHGDYFKVNDESKDEARVKWLDWLLSKIYGKDGYYNFKGNLTGMIIGYSIYSIPIGVILHSFLFCFAGAILGASYGFMGELFPNKYYTKYGEYLGGLFSFLLLQISI